MRSWSAVALLAALSPAALSDDDLREYQQALEAAKLSINDAVAKARQEVPGAVILEIELDWSRSRSQAVYEVELLVGENERDLAIDAVTGKLVQMERDARPDKGRKDESVKAAALAKQTFEQAIDAASKDRQVVQIEIDMRGGKPVYEIRAIEAGRVVRVMIDAVDGAVLR